MLVPSCNYCFYMCYHGFEHHEFLSQLSGFFFLASVLGEFVIDINLN